MDAIELALRKCLHVLVSSSTITERKRNVETFVELLKDNRIHELLDNENLDENKTKRSVTWNEIFNVIREYTVNELASLRTKSAKTLPADIKYQEALKLFKSLVENSNTQGPQLDGRSLLESILSIITSDIWSTCSILIKELSHLLIHHVLSFHKYLNELREQEWLDLCELYMSLSKCSTKTYGESEQALYSSYLKFVIEKVVVYNDLDSNKSTIRQDLFGFLQMEIEQLKNSNHFSVIENFLCSLNHWSFKYLFDMPDEVLRLGNELLPSLIDIWRKKCNEKAKSDIIKFARLQMSIHHPDQRKNTLEIYDDIWLKNLRDLNDLLLREIDEIRHKQRLINRQTSNEFFIRSDLLHLASSVFYQVSLNELLIKNANNDEDDLFEPSAKRTRYEHSMSISTNTDAQMKSFQNLFQSIDSYHQAVGFQIVTVQLERQMKLTASDCDYYINVLKRYLTDERRPSFLVNALRCLHLLLTETSHCQLTSDLILLIQPLIHISICESFVIEILSNGNLSLSNLLSGSSITSLKYLFYSNNQYSSDDQNKLLNKLLPNLISSYRNNEYDLSLFFASYSPEYTHLCASILMKLSSFDHFPSRTIKPVKKSFETEFHQIEYQWSRLKLLLPIHSTAEDNQIPLDFHNKSQILELNLITFKQIIDIFEKNICFVQQLKDKHLGERYKLILHFAFLGIDILDILQKYFTCTSDQNEQTSKFIGHIQILFAELTEEIDFLYEKTKQIPFVSDLLEHIKSCIQISSPISLVKPLLPSIDHFPSVLYGFLDGKFLKYLYNYSTEEISLKKPSEIEGIQCPIDHHSDEKFQAFEILLCLCYQALADEQYSSTSFLSSYSSTYQSNRNLLIRILDEKLCFYLEELPLPNPVSYQYLNKYLSHLCSNPHQYHFVFRCNDLEFLLNIFVQSFRTYRRDPRLCQRFLYFLHSFLRTFDHIIREKFSSNENWILLQKLIDAFWQMTINRNASLNQQSRKSLVQIKQILIKDEPIDFNDCEKILNEPSYCVRLEGYQLCSSLFYETSPKNIHDSFNDDERFALERPNVSPKLRLKSSNEQKTILDYFFEKSSSSILFLSYLSTISEYLSCQITFHLIKLGFNKQLSENLLRHILLPHVSIQSILQFYHQQSFAEIQHFPWQFFKIDSPSQSHSFVFSTYFLSSISDRQQLYAIFPDMKSSVIEYFPQLQASLLSTLAQKSTHSKQAEDHRQMIEKMISKTEYNRLIKQNLTRIILHILLSYSNDQSNEFSDRWSPEAILPANSWIEIKHIFEYIRQMINGKTLIEILMKLTDIGEILLCLSSNLFSTDSLHEQLRLLHVFSLFLTDILLNSMDNDYLHSILRDSTYILLRYIERNSRRISFEIYEEELNEKILNLTCQLLHQLCLKGLDFDSAIYRDHLPDILSSLINHHRYLTQQRLEKILFDIYQFIKHNDDRIFMFLSYAIEKLEYLPTEIQKTSHSITTLDYFIYFSRSSLPVQWNLEMFHNHLEIERQQSSHTSVKIESAMIFLVKQRLIECLKSQTNHLLAGKCLAKCPLFSFNTTNEENLDEDQYEPIPFWILDDLIISYLIDPDQHIVECTRSTLKTLFQHPIGQDFYRKHPKTDLIQIYSKPFLSPVNVSIKTHLTLSSSTNPWLIQSISSFHSWLISLVNHFLEQIQFYYNEKKENGHAYAFLFLQIHQLIQSKIELAKRIFPHLVYCLLLLPTNFNLRAILSKNVTFLLEQLLEKNEEKHFVYLPISKFLFRTINYLRQCPIENLNKRNNDKCSLLSFQNHFWLELDYFQLALCASKYQCYQSALIYADIWTSKQRSILPENDYLTHLYHSDIDLFSSSSNLVDLLVRIHSNMNESDEFYGLDKCFENRPNLYGEFNQLNRNYYDSLFYYDQAASTIDSSKLIQSIRLCGFNHILEQYLHQISPVSNEIFYRIQLTSILTEQNHLTQWKISDDQSSNSIRENLLTIIQRQTRIPSCTIPQLTDHHLWSNVSDIRECSLVNIIDDITRNHQTPQILSNIWLNQRNNPINENLFDQNDELFLTRVATTKKLLLHNLHEDSENQDTKQTLLADLVTQLCQNALDSKKLQLCERYLNDLSPLINPSFSHELSFLRAKVLVLRQQDTAGEYLRQLIESPLPISIHIRCRLLLCDWLNKTRCETSSTIKQQLDAISTSLQTLDKSSLALIFESYLAMAYFSDNEYQRLNQLFHSPIFENKRLLISRNQIEYTKQEKLDPLGRYTKVLKRSLDMDKKEIEEQKKLQYSYLISTLNNYLICLKFFSHLTKKEQKSNEIIPSNHSVPEIMITSKCLSYWLTNSTNDEVNKTLKKNLLQIPTHFFLPFVYQMAARMALINEKVSAFHSILLEYLSQCILDHPHHVLPVIFALVNAHKDAHINQQVTKKISTTELIPLNNEITNDPRSRAAQYLLDKCTKDKPQLVDQMRQLNDAYIEAAYWDPTPTKTDQQGKTPIFPKQLRLMHVKDFHEVAVPTITIPIANDGNYKNIETIKSFNPEYTMVGGVNAPKKLLCHSSIGRSLPQLLKGKDDLRQDAVMQQLFTVMNRLLDKDDLTSHRSLNIRTYKVVPLTQKSGVLEWCEGTITFGDYLAKDRDGAHSRYHPEDWTAMDCRRHIHKATNSGKDERRRAFIYACSRLKPVLRYFFYEHYNKPSTWHSRKQAYAKSVATSSIVGYVVGLGDRHVQNILIDTQSAEVIHIDLGVAFDQGKMLPIPETIPFRLTRDLIDGLGICGTEGLFKKSCEITLELMRQYADTLITIIEVFLYDPLYQWQLSPQKALQLQQQFDKTNNDSATPSSHRSSGRGVMLPPPSSSTIVGGESGTTDTNKMAERLLLGLRQKLQGVERLNQMTIKAHVNMLFQEATSIDNLSQLFAGWQPYL